MTSSSSSSLRSAWDSGSVIRDMHLKPPGSGSLWFSAAGHAELCLCLFWLSAIRQRHPNAPEKCRGLNVPVRVFCRYALETTWAGFLVAQCCWGARNCNSFSGRLSSGNATPDSWTTKGPECSGSVFVDMHLKPPGSGSSWLRAAGRHATAPLFPGRLSSGNATPDSWAT